MSKAYGTKADAMFLTDRYEDSPIDRVVSTET